MNTATSLDADTEYVKSVHRLLSHSPEELMQWRALMRLLTLSFMPSLKNRHSAVLVTSHDPETLTIHPINETSTLKAGELLQLACDAVMQHEMQSIQEEQMTKQ